LKYGIISESTPAVAVMGHVDGQSATGALSIPASVTYNGKNYSVTAVDLSSFHDCNGLTSLTLPNTITSIGNHAFFECTGFTGPLTIPDSVTSIGESAFGGCVGFTSLSIGSGVQTIGEQAFSDCEGIVGTVTIPSSVTTIIDGAFAGCGGTELIVESGNANYKAVDGMLMTKDGTYMIGSLISKTGQLNIPSGVNHITVYAFLNCTKITELIIPDGVEYIDYNAFENCSGLTSMTIPSSVTTINDDAFLGITFYAENGTTKLSPTVGNLSGHSFSGTSTKMVRDPVVTYSVTYVSSGQTSGSVPTDGTAYKSGDTATVLGNTGDLVRDGYTFGGWSYNGVTYKAGDKITISENVVLTAVFNSNAAPSSDNTAIIAVCAVVVVAILCGAGYYFLKRR
jgi:hypothetical protein